MSDFDALLKRSFAEAPEPADDGFSVRIAETVAHREHALKVRQWVQTGAFALAAATVAYGAYSVAGALGPELQAAIGLQLAEAQTSLSAAPSPASLVDSVAAAFGAGLTQILLATIALAGGAVAYRAVQQD